jgi:hypothetical protein
MWPTNSAGSRPPFITDPSGPSAARCHSFGKPQASICRKVTISRSVCCCHSWGISATDGKATMPVAPASGNPARCKPADGRHTTDRQGQRQQGQWAHCRYAATLPSIACIASSENGKPTGDAIGVLPPTGQNGKPCTRRIVCRFAAQSDGESRLLLYRMIRTFIRHARHNDAKNEHYQPLVNLYAGTGRIAELVQVSSRLCPEPGRLGILVGP